MAKKKTPKKGEYWTKEPRRPKRDLKKMLKKAGINIPERKKAMRFHGNRNANWL